VKPDKKKKMKVEEAETVKAFLLQKKKKEKNKTKQNKKKKKRRKSRRSLFRVCSPEKNERSKGGKTNKSFHGTEETTEWQEVSEGIGFVGKG
jgi:hypothetical protein